MQFNASFRLAVDTGRPGAEGGSAASALLKLYGVNSLSIIQTDCLSCPSAEPEQGSQTCRADYCQTDPDHDRTFISGAGR